MTREEMIAQIRAQRAGVPQLLAANPEPAPTQAPAPAAEPSREEMLAQLRGVPAPTAQPSPHPASNDPGLGNAVLQGFGQGAAIGYIPELQAKTASVLQDILPESMGGGGNESYEALKKSFKRRDEALKAAHPYATTAAEIAGGASAMPFGGPAGEIGLGAKLARAAGTGAGYGFLSNTDVESSDQDPHAELKARLLNAGIGAGAGTLMEGAVHGVGSYLNKGGARTADRAVMKQMGANAGDVKKILQKDELPKLTGFMKDEGLMGVGSTIDDTLEQSGKVLAEDGPKIGQLYKDVQASAEKAGAHSPKIDGNKIADEIMENAKKNYRIHADRDVVLKEMESKVAPLRDLGPDANIVDLHNYRKSLDDGIDWNKAARERPAIQDAMVDARNIVADKTKGVINSLDTMSGSGNADLLKKLNNRYSAASTVNSIATKGAAREAAKALMGHGIIGAGAGVGGGYLEYQRSHDPIKAAAAGIGTALAVGAARKFGPPVGFYGGKGAQAVGNAIQKLAPGAAKLGAGGAAGAAPWLYMRGR